MLHHKGRSNADNGGKRCGEKASAEPGDPMQLGSFCRDTFAGGTELTTGIRDKSLMAIMLSAGTAIARKTCVLK
jgi:hypothetical protein